jgi:hypothetical protein
MNARLQRSKIKRIRVEKWVGRIRTAAAAERPVGREEPKASKKKVFRAAGGFNVRGKSMEWPSANLPF